MARFLRAMIWVSLVAVAIIVIQSSMWSAGQSRQLQYGEFMQLVEQRKVASLVVDPKNVGHGLLAGGEKYLGQPAGHQ